MKVANQAVSLSVLAAIAFGAAPALAQTVVQGPIINPANGHTYYRLSNSNWTAAEAAAVALGGHLVTINDSAENEFVRATFANAPGAGRVWLGYNDGATEGSFVWANGEPTSYTLWAAGEPNNNGNEDYTVMYANNGNWADVADLASPPGIGDVYGVVEFLSQVVQGPIINPANGHTYYRLSNSNWTAAEAAAVALGGHLVTINDSAENEFVRSNFASAVGVGRVWLGYNDAATEGSFVWANGEPSSYIRWEVGEPNNAGNEDYTSMYWNTGNWNDAADLANPGIGPVYGVVETEVTVHSILQPVTDQSFGANCHGQTFTPNIGVVPSAGAAPSMLLTGITLYRGTLGANAPSAATYLDIYDGDPNGAGVFIGSSTNTVDTTLNAAGTQYQWTFNQLALASATEHWAVMSTTALAGNVDVRVSLLSNSMNAYLGGAGIVNGVVKQAQSQDAQFAIYLIGNAQIATNTILGAGCYRKFASFYEFFGTAASFDLSGSSFTFNVNSDGSVSSAGTLNPVGSLSTPTVLPLGDDTSLSVGTLGLTVHANGIVWFGSGSSTLALPQVGTFLNDMTASVRVWHDFNPTAFGSGKVKYEQAGTRAQITWDGVYGYGFITPNTFQFQIDTATGIVVVAFGSVSGLGGPVLVGYSPSGASSDPGSLDISTSLPVPLATVDRVPLTLTPNTRPILGTTWSHTISNIPSGGVALSILGLSDPNIPDMAFLGMPGCGMRASLDVIDVLPGGPSVGAQFQVPNIVGLIGTALFMNGAALAPGENAFGIITSNGVRGVVGDI